MDFETTFPALPRLEGMRPYDHVPFQWSVHRQEWDDAPIKRYDFLAETTADPRVPFLESLCQAVNGAGKIVVYNQTFEASRLDDLAKWLPKFRSEIAEIKTKLWDLYAVIKRSVYHPAFGGSFSLKSVLPALVPGMSYEGLDVAEGMQAGIIWGRFVHPATPSEEKTQLKMELLDYCGQDTLGLARIVEMLMKMKETHAPTG